MISTGESIFLSRPKPHSYFSFLRMTPSFVDIQFFLTQLRTEKKELAYYIGIQAAVSKRGPGQMPSNPGAFFQGSKRSSVDIIYDSLFLYR